ncbi:phenazine biosynthesis protein [Xenorhabdus nematophila]|uniref:PhzA/PhzB family protein n=1 Tax=Xenorhabdus nematophila TaxID=628 RepID=UPI000542B9D2|nr:PhzA/PhzB family protein [Xenorhabdus nematophila]CEF29675.1 Phenazine biosynthesis protein PhzB 1 [Xenorhabdus nematophila str. Websteri]AYA39301.1 phenazine biosynthesis protein [Xenorhabdus nematophila]KHD28257.1 phenazine biosynthesis protein [Xenorhabdus nematophila]MBA0017879.1 phenazine biosynthesis protein [Xenorhabdus nematophila]MCB4426379.1 phenazine biosynthesis protein [Xenorhabdus nematophila]
MNKYNDKFGQLREKNRKIVEKYLKFTKGEARLERHKLFAENAESGLWTTETGEPIIIRGIENLARHAHWSLQCFPDWEWYNINIFTTDNPDHIWVECDGHGIIRFSGYPERYYENHFIHSFELCDGFIIRNREFMNPVNQLKALDIIVPKINRQGIPT